MKSSCALFLFMFCLVTSCTSQTDVTGKWYGSTKSHGFDMRIVFDIKLSDGVYSATLLSPDQTTQEIPATFVDFRDNELTFKVDNIGFSFTGKQHKDGVIEGVFTQGGQSFKLDLSRKEITREGRPQEPLPPYPYKEEEVAFQNQKAGIRLAGTLTLPRTPGKFTAVVLVSGSGAQNRNEELLGHKPFLVLADYLTRRGVAVLRYDDRGVGQSEGIYTEATLSDFATDAEAAIAYLKTREEIDGEKIGIAGHSEGGCIAFMLAAEQKTAFVVSLAGPGIKGTDLMELQRKAIFTASNIPEDYINQYNDYVTKAQHIAMRVTDKEQLQKGITELFAGTPMEQHTHAAIKQFSSPEIISFLQYDPEPLFKQIKCPVLALNGMKDLQVPSGENLSGILEGITANGNKKVTTKPYYNLNHLFQTAATGLPDEYGSIEETFNEEPLKDIAEWIIKR